MRTVPLYGPKAAGRVARVSDHRFDLVMQYKWFVYENHIRGRHDGPYARTPLGRRGPYLHMHVLIMGQRGVDHIDHDGLNNQDENLRLATQAQNVHNNRGRRKATSAFKGVSWDRVREKWTAHISVDGNQVNLGRFPSEAEAARVYDAAALAAWGEFAYLNFRDAA